MCGRYVNVASTDNLVEEYQIDEVEDEQLPPSWNIAPTEQVRIVVERRPREAKNDPHTPAHRQLRTAQWGLVPSWSKDARGGARMINARIETVTSKPTFSTAARRRRCLLPALGYYEWQHVDNQRVPYFLHDPAGRTLAMAGLYDFWRDETKADDDPGRWLCSTSIITQQASDTLGEIHDRNPVIVPPHLWSAWLDCTDDDPAHVQALLAGLPPAPLEPYRVGRAVGNVRNNDPSLIEPVPPQPTLGVLAD